VKLNKNINETLNATACNNGGIVNTKSGEARGEGHNGLSIAVDRAENDQPLEVAGLCNSKVVDAIKGGMDGSVELYLIQELSWHDYPSDILKRVEDKLNNYLDYVVDGFFGRHYPQYRGRQITFVFNYRAEPPFQEGPSGHIASLLSSFARCANLYNIRLVTRELG
jgi:hypothetical protein